jgi:hypothetical protein
MVFPVRSISLTTSSTPSPPPPDAHRNPARADNRPDSRSPVVRRQTPSFERAARSPHASRQGPVRRSLSTGGVRGRAGRLPRLCPFPPYLLQFQPPRLIFSCFGLPVEQVLSASPAVHARDEAMGHPDGTARPVRSLHGLEDRPRGQKGRARDPGLCKVRFTFFFCTSLAANRVGLIRPSFGLTASDLEAAPVSRIDIFNSFPSRLERGRME